MTEVINNKIVGVGWPISSKDRREEYLLCNVCVMDIL